MTSPRGERDAVSGIIPDVFGIFLEVNRLAFVDTAANIKEPGDVFQ
jgi:hypothetical protein